MIYYAGISLKVKKISIYKKYALSLYIVKLRHIIFYKSSIRLYINFFLKMKYNVKEQFQFQVYNRQNRFIYSNSSKISLLTLL
jgi:hypothetical protein